MIAVDTSALMAIVLDEAEADACIAVLETEDNILISAGTIAEALIVAARRNVGDRDRKPDRRTWLQRRRRHSSFRATDCFRPTVAGEKASILPA